MRSVTPATPPQPHRSTSAWLGGAILCAVIAIIVMVLGIVIATRNPHSPESVSKDTSVRSQQQSTGAHSTNTEAVHQNSYNTLPGGDSFTRKGKGTFRTLPVHRGIAVIPPLPAGVTVPGYNAAGIIVSTAVYYTIDIENGLDRSTYGGDDTFQWWIHTTLSDVRGWTSGGKRVFAQVDNTTQSSRAPIRITLASPLTTRHYCGYSVHAETSCWNSDKNRVIINLARFVRGSSTYPGDIQNYRRYLINHELGHALGFTHEMCDADGNRAPVMMQQTLTLANSDIEKLDPAMFAAIPEGARDSRGKDLRTARCRPNPWPNPENMPEFSRNTLPLTRR